MERSSLQIWAKLIDGLGRDSKAIPLIFTTSNLSSSLLMLLNDGDLGDDDLGDDDGDDGDDNGDFLLWCGSIIIIVIICSLICPCGCWWYVSSHIIFIYVCFFVYMFVYMVREEGNDQTIRWEVRAYIVFVYCTETLERCTDEKF